MKVTIIVNLKPSILEPEGTTIHRVLESIGINSITSLRKGKVFEVEVSETLSYDKTKEVIERLAKEVLTSPVTEEYKILW